MEMGSIDGTIDLGELEEVEANENTMHCRSGERWEPMKKRDEEARKTTRRRRM